MCYFLWWVPEVGWFGRKDLSVVYEIIEIDFVVAGIPEVDADVFVVSDGVAGEGIVTGRWEYDAIDVVTCDVASKGVVTGRIEVDAEVVAADGVTGNGIIIARIRGVDADIVIADIIARNGVITGMVEQYADVIVVTDCIVWDYTIIRFPKLYTTMGIR